MTGTSAAMLPSAAEVSVKFQSGRIILNTNLAASSVCELLRLDVLLDIETGPRTIEKYVSHEDVV